MSHILEQQIAEIKAFIITQSLREKEIMILREAAAYMGVSKSYLYKLTCSRTIPFYRPGAKIIFFQRSDLDAWMLSSKVRSLDELSKLPDRRKRDE